MLAFSVLIGAFDPAAGWSAFSQTHIAASAREARTAVLSHPDAAAGQWRIITVTEVPVYPLAVAS